MYFLQYEKKYHIYLYKYWNTVLLFSIIYYLYLQKENNIFSLKKDLIQTVLLTVRAAPF